MTNLLELKASSKLEQLKKELETISYFAFTTDVWQTKNKKNSFLRYLN